MITSYSKESVLHVLKSEFPVLGRLYEYFLTVGKDKTGSYLRIQFSDRVLESTNADKLYLFNTSFCWSEMESELGSIYGAGSYNISTLLSCCNSTLGGKRDLNQEIVSKYFAQIPLKSIGDGIPECCSKAFFEYPKLPAPWNTIVAIIKSKPCSFSSFDSKLLLIIAKGVLK